jgi:type IV secretory pathway VirB2 component (pilin)
MKNRFQRVREKGRKVMIAAASMAVLFPVRAYAATAGGGMPWDATLTVILDDLQGPVAHVIVMATVVAAGFMWGVSEHGAGVRRFSALAFGGALALGAVQAYTYMFPTATALF